MSRILLRCKWPIELIVVLLGPLLIGVPPVPRLRPCRALQKSPLFVRWRHSGILRACGSMVKFYTVYCASSHHENILCNFGTNLHFCIIFNCCEARTVNCTRAIEHRNEIAKCFLTVRILGNILRLCIPCIDIMFPFIDIMFQPIRLFVGGHGPIYRAMLGGDWKCETWKYGTVKNAGPENARHEFAAPVCTGGNCGTQKMRDQFAGVENAEKVSMESQSVKVSQSSCICMQSCSFSTSLFDK